MVKQSEEQNETHTNENQTKSVQRVLLKSFNQAVIKKKTTRLENRSLVTATHNRYKHVTSCHCKVEGVTKHRDRR